MKNILFAAVAALALTASSAAFAGESNNPAGVQTTSQPIVASVIASQANANAYPSFAGGEVSTTANVALNGRGAQAEPEFAGQAATVGGPAQAVATLPTGAAS